MSGTIRKKGKNSFQINIYTGQKDKDGKRQRVTETVHGSKAAKDRLVELQFSLQKGTLTAPGRTTLAEWLHKWLDGYVKTNCSERTLEGYSSIIEQHLIPALGQIQLKNLRAQTIQAYYGKAIEKLSARTVHHQHRVLSQALKYAVRQGYSGRNPAEMVDPPQPRKNQMRTLTAAEVETLLTSVKDSNYYPVIYTAISTGLRQAEILGLRWRDLDLDMASISVSQVLFVKRGQAQFKEPKTSHSRRRVSMTPKLAIFLREYKAQQEVYYNELGQPMTLDTLVFTTPEGNPIDASELSHVFSRLASQVVLGHVRFHDLRHTFASLMLLRGAKPKVISEALGHASVGFTMDVYSHIIEGMQQDAMALLDEVLPVGINSSKNKINANLTPTFNIMVNNN